MMRLNIASDYRAISWFRIHTMNETYRKPWPQNPLKPRPASTRSCWHFAICRRYIIGHKQSINLMVIVYPKFTRTKAFCCSIQTILFT